MSDWNNCVRYTAAPTSLPFHYAPTSLSHFQHCSSLGRKHKHTEFIVPNKDTGPHTRGWCPETASVTIKAHYRIDTPEADSCGTTRQVTRYCLTFSLRLEPLHRQLAPPFYHNSFSCQIYDRAMAIQADIYFISHILHTLTQHSAVECEISLRRTGGSSSVCWVNSKSVATETQVKLLKCFGS